MAETRAGVSTGHLLQASHTCGAEYGHDRQNAVEDYLSVEPKVTRGRGRSPAATVLRKTRRPLLDFDEVPGKGPRVCGNEVLVVFPEIVRRRTTAKGLALITYSVPVMVRKRRRRLACFQLNGLKL